MKKLRSLIRSRQILAAATSCIESLEQRTLLAVGGGGGTGAGGGDGGGGTILTYPTATLLAKNVANWGTNYTFTVTYLSNKRIRTAQLDGNDIRVTGPNGYSRLARLVGYVDNVKQVIARYKISTPNSTWSAADNGTYNVSMVTRQLSDASNNYVTAGKIGRAIASLPAYPTDVGQRQNVPLGAVDASKFGAIPDDRKDDTAAIQAAIDSLPHPSGYGSPDATAPLGGEVWLAAGTYDLAGTIKVPSSVMLRGVGAQTILSNTSSNTASAAILIWSPFTHSIISYAGVKDLSINTRAAKGIASDSASAGLIFGTFERLTINSFGTALDFRTNDVYQTTIRDVTINNPGTTAIWLTVFTAGGNSALNRIEDVVIQGAARSGFISDTGLVVLGGDIAVNRLSINDTGAPITPLVLKTGFATFTDLSLPTWTGTGVMVKIDGYRVDFDQLANLASNRMLSITGARDVHVGKLSVASGNTLAQAVSTDSSSHLAVDELYAGGGVGDIDKVEVGVAQRFSSRLLTPAKPKIRTTEIAAVSPVMVNATAFGAIPGDGKDDSVAIQAAIDSLPRGNGIPDGNPQNPVGGTVTLPNGIFNLSTPLQLPSGVWLQGQGSGTDLNSSAATGSAAIALVAGASAGYNAGAGVSDLSIYTSAADGIRADAALTNGLIDFRASGLVLSCGGTGINLRPARAFHTNIDNILISNPGGCAIWVGDDAGYSADNHVINVGLGGTTRANFSAERAMYVFTGQTTIDDVSMESITRPVLPLYVSGTADIRGIWLDAPAAELPNGILASFQNSSRITIDRLVSANFDRKIQIRDANVQIGYVNIAGSFGTLPQVLDIDDASTLRVGTVNSIFDAGMLDDPRISVGGVFNQTVGRYTDTALAHDDSRNLLPDSSQWQMQYGDSLGSVSGHTFEDGAGFHVVITSNPNRRPTTITINLNVTDDVVGDSVIGRWRVDGPAAPTMFSTQFAGQYFTRAFNTETAVVGPTALKRGDKLLIMLPYNITSGEFIFSNLAIIPIG